MSNPNDMWTSFSDTIEMWKNSYQQWQQAGLDAVKLYTQAFQISQKTSDFESIKKYNELWMKTCQAYGGENPSSWYLKAWSSIWKEADFTSFESFSKYWENIWKMYSNSSLDKFQNTMNQVNESKPIQNED